MWGGYLKGENKTHEAVLLANLPPGRVATAKKMHDDTFEARKASKAKGNKKRTDALVAAGLVEPRAKKAKVATSSASSASSSAGSSSSSSGVGV